MLDRAARLVVHYEQGAREEATRMLQQIENLYIILQAELGDGYFPNTRVFLLEMPEPPENFSFRHGNSAIGWSTLYIYPGARAFLDPEASQTWLFFHQLAHELHHVLSLGRLEAALPDWYSEGAGEVLGFLAVTRLYGGDANALAWLQKKEIQGSQALAHPQISSRLLDWSYGHDKKAKESSRHSLESFLKHHRTVENVLFYSASFALVKTIFGRAVENGYAHPSREILRALSKKRYSKNIPNEALIQTIQKRFSVDVRAILPPPRRANPEKTSSSTGAPLCFVEGLH